MGSDENQSQTEGQPATVAPTKRSLNVIELAKDMRKPQMPVEYRDGLWFTLSFLGRSRLQTMMKNCTKMKLNPLTATREPTLDNDLFLSAFVAEVFHGWKGMTPRRLSDILPIDTKGFSEEELDAEIPYSQDQMTHILKNAYELDTFVQTFVQDLRNFEPHKEHEEKNS